MRFLPAICELAKTLGFNDIGVGTLVKILDYFCYFISDVLFKDYFFKIKNNINDQLKMFSESMFKSMDKFKTDEVLVKFDIGGSIFVQKIDAILKLLEDGVTLSTVLNECFKDEGYTYSYWTENEYFDNEFEYDDFEYDPKEEGDIIIEKVDKVEDDKEGTIIHPGGGSDSGFIEDIIVEKVKKPSVVIDEDLNIKVIVPDLEDDKTIDEIIKIKDKIESVKNKEINKIINEINQLEKEIGKELEKVRPNYPNIKDKKEEVKKKNEELSKLKDKVTTPINRDWEDNRENVIISDFINDELNFDRVNDLLDELNKVVYENDLVLTNHEIIRLLK